MDLRCPACGSKDLWQPRRFKSAWDRVLERFGYQGLDCRKCKKRSAFPLERRKRDRRTSTAPKIDPAPSPAPHTVLETIGEGTTIAPGLRIYGELSSSESIRVQGEVKGTVDVKGSGLVIEHGGSVTGTVQAAFIVVHGILRGGSVTSDRITVCRNGSVIADVRAGSIAVEEGAYLQGKLDTVA